MKIIFATGNRGKLREINQIFEGTGFEVISMKDAGIDIKIDENGTTFEENSYIKAKTVWDVTGGYVMADDSGFMIDFLNGAPGVYSARYMGEDTDYKIKCAAILHELEGVEKEKRGARYEAVVTCILPDGRTVSSKGILEGLVNDIQAGDGGFGFDPIFYVPMYNKTVAQLTPEEKNAISHRGQALREIRNKISELK